MLLCGYYVFTFFMEVSGIANKEKELYVNEQIRAKEVMVIGPNGEQLGIKDIKDALTLASYAGFRQDLQLDLVPLEGRHEEKVPAYALFLCPPQNLVCLFLQRHILHDPLPRHRLTPLRRLYYAVFKYPPRWCNR